MVLVEPTQLYEFSGYEHADETVLIAFIRTLDMCKSLYLLEKVNENPKPLKAFRYNFAGQPNQKSRQV